MTGTVRAPLSLPHRALALVGAALLVLAVTALLPGPAAASAGAAGDRATFLVLLEPGVDPGQAGRDIAGQHGGQLGFVYRHAVRGIAVTLPEQAAAGLARDPRVASVHRDQVFTIAAQTTPTGVARTFAPDNAQMEIDGGGPAVDVDIAILDTGLDMSHPDLNDVGGADCTTVTTTSGCQEGTYQDGHGHGTHVAGSAAAIDNGVGVVGTAPGARLHGLKVLGDDGVGHESWIVAALDWVVKHNTDADETNDIEVANLSLGCECQSPTQDKAIDTAVAEGVTVVVAAGNAGKDASTFNPANHPKVITVSALADANGTPGGGGRFNCTFGEKDDTLANFSNWGSPIEIASPGMCISSTVPGGYGTKSGTSMASPHVAGAVGVLASSRPGATPAELETLLLSAGNFDWTDDSGDGTREPLLDLGDGNVFDPTMVGAADDGSGTATNGAPSASFASTCTGLTCAFDGSGSTDDGSIASWAWYFGDGSTGSGATASHSYAEGGAYTVQLTVTDDAGATSSTSQSVTVSAPSSSAMSLTASGYKVKGVQHVDLSWTGGATSTSVDVYRGSTKVDVTANDGAYTDSTGRKGGGSYTYKVCQAGTSTCSNEATVTL